MRPHRPLAALTMVIVATAVGAVSFAQTKTKPATKATPIAAPSGSGAAAKGITAYDQQIIDAQKSFQAGLAGGSVDDAIAGYRKAIELDPNRPEGHLLLGAALYHKGDLAGADEALGNAANRARADKAYANFLGKALFLSATVKESMNKPADAKVAWRAYADFAKENPDQDAPQGAGSAPPMTVKVYPAAPVERETKIDAYEKLANDYAKVKELVEKRMRELGEGPKPAPSTK